MDTTFPNLKEKEDTMELPPLDADSLFEDLVQDLPPETARMAREFKAFTRARKIKTPSHLLRVVLLYCGLDKSLREVAGNFTRLVERITDSSIAERLGACRPWVKALLAKMLERSELGALPETRRFLVIDGSTVQSPAATGISYRLHICMDLVSLEFTHIAITDKRTGESLRQFPLGVGDVAIVDRGYGHPGAMLATLEAGADLILRLNPHNVPLCERDGRPLEMVRALEDQSFATVRTLPVLLGAPSPCADVLGWVHAYRLCEEQANRARQACRKRNRKHTPKQSTLFLAGWVLVFTSLAPEQLSAQTVMAVYRTRWQVEVAIKRWKSLLDLDELRARQGSALAELWLHGKLLYALMLEGRMRRTLGDAWGRLDQERQATWWRPWKLMRDAITPRITGALYWSEQGWEACLEVLRERPRRRTLQRLPAEACTLVHLPHTLPTPPREQEWQEEMAA